MIEITPDIDYLVKERISKLLHQGKTVQKTVTKTIRRFEINEDGDMIPLTMEVHTTTETSLEDTPPYVLKEILNSMNLELAYKLLTNKGYIITDPSIKEDKQEENNGLTDKTVEEIKLKLLGIDNDA